MASGKPPSARMGYLTHVIGIQQRFSGTEVSPLEGISSFAIGIAHRIR
jgi:hypothetical protein